MAITPWIAGRRFHANAGRNATDGDPRDVPATQLQIRGALDNDYVAIRYAKLRHEFCEVGCERWRLRRLIEQRR